MNKDRSVVSIVRGNIQETPFQYSQKDIKIVKDMIVESLDLIGGLQKIIGRGGSV